MLQLRCRCGLQSGAARVGISDARQARLDPTGTSRIRNRLKRDLDARWAKVRRASAAIIDRNDAMGLTASHESRASMQIGADALSAFATWFEHTCLQFVMGYTGHWMQSYVDDASAAARARASRITGRIGPPDARRVAVLRAIPIAELQGVIDAAQQQAVRALGTALLSGQRPSQAARAVGAVINAVGVKRSRLVGEYVVVKTFSSMTLDAFRQAGVKNVGTEAERIIVVRGPHGLTEKRDAAPVQLKRTHFLRDLSERTARRREAVVQELGEVDVLTAGDDLVCEECQDISDNGPYDIDTAEGLIPAHPNAVLEGSTIASYGSMHEMVRARFRGPAINLRTSAKSVTIGPNHPMLTRRGFVKARDLREGDELLYDLRTENLGSSRMTSHLKQMPMVEDVFSTLSLVFGFMSTTAHHDLHGDATFCDGEIDAVHPTLNLLPILDPCGIEKLGKQSLPLSDADLEFVATLGSGQSNLEAVPLSSSGSMSCGDLEHSSGHSPRRSLDPLLFGLSPESGSSLNENGLDDSSAGLVSLSERHDAGPFLVSRGYLGESFYRWVRVLEVHEEEFSGWAFDASTDSGLYNNNGFVVHNCRCAFIPVSDARFAAVGEEDDLGDSVQDYNPYHLGAGPGGGQFATAEGLGGGGSSDHTSAAEELFSDYATGSLVKEASGGNPAKAGDMAEGQEITQAEADEINAAASHLQELSSSSISDHREVWRGVALQKGTDVSGEYARNKVVEFKTLTATSGSRKLAEKYTDPQYAGSDEAEKVLLRISRRGGVIGHDSGSGELAGGETILPAGSRYRVASVERAGDTTIVSLYDPGSLNKRKVKDFNPYHLGAGPGGGQFAAAEGGGASWTHESLIAKGKAVEKSLRNTSVLGTNSDVIATLAYPLRRSDEAMDEIEKVANGSDFDSMLSAIDSQSAWQRAWAVAGKDWQAARIIGGNGEMSKVTRAELKDISPNEIKAFEARQKWMQDQFRKEHGDSVTVYRGVSGAYAKKLESGDIDASQYQLSSWTTNAYEASQFAKGKNGRVISTDVKADEVWLLPRRGVEGVIKIADASSEIVTLNKSKTRRVKVL